MAVKLLNITFPVSLEKLHIVHSVANAFIANAYGNNGWYCDTTKSFFIFTKNTKEAVQSELNEITGNLPSYSVNELNTVPLDLPTDTLSWIKARLDSIQQLTDLVLKD